VQLTGAQREHRAQKIAVKIKARMTELSLSQAEVARRCNISTATFRNRLLRFSSAQQDIVSLAQLSLAMEWPVEYLSKVLDGTYDLSDDPAALPATPSPAQKTLPRKRKVVAPPQERLAESDLDAHISALVAAAPTLTPAQAERIRNIVPALTPAKVSKLAVNERAAPPLAERVAELERVVARLARHEQSRNLHPPQTPATSTNGNGAHEQRYRA
jgi:transcriptional regulator with XRE-family HTH domain